MSEELPTRNVASQPISKSFKGILRVSNVKEIGSSNDVFLNPSYYGEYQPTPEKPLWEPVGIQATESVLNGENGRYVTADDYTTLKIPVTDSVGNYLNFSLGTDSSSIGNTIESGIWSLKGPEFYTLSADSITSGLSEIELKNKKTVKGGKLFIDNKDAEIAKIIVNNYYRHGSGDSTGKFTEVDKETKTVYKGSSDNNLYDAFLFRQDDIENDAKIEDDKVVNEPTKQHAIVKLTNLKDYVMDKIGAYIKYNTTEIPPGTIINQYCSLDKWYCRTDGNIFDDSENWQGYRPALGGVSTTFSESNTVQGAYSKTTKLEYNMSSYVFESVEMPPDFKRGYVLADGSAYNIHFTPPYANDVASTKNDNKTMDLFFDLFFTIGYYYTPSVDLYPHVYYEAADAPVNEDKMLTSKPTYGRYYYDYNKPAIQEYGWTRMDAASHPVDHETLYGISLITALAFNKFKEVYQNKYDYNKYIADADGNWDIEKSINWLANQSIDERYVFNTVFSNDSIEKEGKAENGKFKVIDNLIYTYKDADNNEVAVTIGKEVKSFSDYIEYYEVGPDTDGTTKIYKTYCQIYKTAEVYDIARLFAAKSMQWGNYTIRFNVPALWTSNDNAINEFNSMSGNGNTGEVGLFIGSNGLLLADSITVPSKNITESESLIYNNNLDRYTYHQSNCAFTIGYQPHAHALAKGILNLSEGAYKFDPEKQPVDLKPLSVSDIDAKNTLKDLTELNNNIISADTTWDATMLKSSISGPQTWANEPAAMNYFLQERGVNQGVKLRPIHNAFNGLMGKELAVFDDKGNLNDKMLWYGRTGEPLWDPDPKSSATSQKYTLNNNPGYFRPQSIKLLPLIKL